MPPTLHIGCCGWSYLNEHEFDGFYTKHRDSILQSYAQLFSTVEINSTFYRLPRPTTAAKWRAEADAVNTRFEFTVKAFQGITHLHRFRGTESHDAFSHLKQVCRILHARVLLFQSPASFKPTGGNIEAMRSFFERADRAELQCVWEPRGAWYDEPGLVTEVCEQCALVHCVDPLRNEVLIDGAMVYFRLHGFGHPSMYRYSFCREELSQIGKIFHGLPENTHDAYLLFNNVDCYHNAREIMGSLHAGS